MLELSANTDNINLCYMFVTFRICVPTFEERVVVMSISCG